MRRLGSVAVALSLLLLPGCGGGDDPTKAQTRTVGIDYNYDEFAGSFLAYFPQVVTVRPGDTIEFSQAWTGEPHTVTLGTLVDKAVKPVRELKRLGPLPEKPPPEIEAALRPLPFVLNDDLTVNQAAAQPCYLDDGPPPPDRDAACPKRRQPAFNGRQSYYSSGFIPYEGNRRNTYRLPLADDIQPGSYTFYCAVHGPFQSGEIVVKPKGSSIPSQSQVSRQGREEVQKLARPLLRAYEEAKAGRARGPEGAPIKAYLSGYFSESVQEAFISEFVPRTINAKVGQKVTWEFLGSHTVSFDVPSYFPEFIIDDDGRVTANPDAFQPRGGPGAASGQPPDAPPPEVDAGRWDGSGFLSSGVQYGGTYSVTFTKRGRYKYACVIHPRMVGEVVVS